MDLLDPFSCQLHHIAFDRLKSHTPLSCPGTQSINIPLKFHCVFFSLNLTIANTVIIKKVLFQTQYLMRCHLCTERTTRDQERYPGGHPTKPEPSQIYSIYNNSLLSEAKKRIYPFQYLSTNSIAKQFAFKEFMRGCIKCLFKIQYECVNLSSIVQDFSPIIYSIVNWVSQLCPFLNACYLSDRSFFYQDEPWYLNIQWRLNLKLHKVHLMCTWVARHL